MAAREGACDEVLEKPHKGWDSPIPRREGASPARTREGPRRIYAGEPSPAHAGEEKAGTPPMDGPVVEFMSGREEKETLMVGKRRICQR